MTFALLTQQIYQEADRPLQILDTTNAKYLLQKVNFAQNLWLYFACVISQVPGIYHLFGLHRKHFHSNLGYSYQSQQQLTAQFCQHYLAEKPHLTYLEEEDYSTTKVVV